MAIRTNGRSYPQSPYGEVDGVINAYLLGTGWALHTEWADRPARFFKVPADPPLECFLLSVSPPLNGQITIFAAAVDRDGDTEIEESWSGLVSELSGALAAAVALIEEWRRDFGQNATTLTVAQPLISQTKAPQGSGRSMPRAAEDLAHLVDQVEPDAGFRKRGQHRGGNNRIAQRVKHLLYRPMRIRW